MLTEDINLYFIEYYEYNLWNIEQIFYVAY